MKNKKALGLLLTANVISGFAQGISMLSIPWYFTSVVDKTQFFAMLYGVVTFLTLFWSLYAGSLIDRYSRKKIFLYISFAGGIVLGLVSLAGYFLGHVPASLVAVVFTTTVFIYNVHYPALYAFGQEITEKKYYGKTNAWFEIQGQATTIAGGAVGAIMLSGTQNMEVNLLGFKIPLGFDIFPWELHEIFLLDTITYFIAILLIALIRYQPEIKLEVHTGNVIDRIKMGFGYLKNNRLILLFGNLSHAIFVILLVEVHLLLPQYIDRHLLSGADAYASSEIYYAIGALLAGLGIRWMFRKTNPVKAVIVLMIVTSLILFVVTFTQSLLIFFIFSFLIGITNAGARVLRITYLFNHIPNNYMGRTGSVFQMVNILLRTIFIGVFSMAFFTIGSKITWAYFIGGIFILISAVPLIYKYKSLVEVPSLKHD